MFRSQEGSTRSCMGRTSKMTAIIRVATGQSRHICIQAAMADPDKAWAKNARSAPTCHKRGDGSTRTL